eukprot:14025125-Alexandrium_andersonii.AAC.1
MVCVEQRAWHLFPTSQLFARARPWAPAFPITNTFTVLGQGCRAAMGSKLRWLDGCGTACRKP